MCIHTFKEIHFLLFVVCWSRDGECSVNVVWNLFEAHGDISRVIFVQDVAIETPVLVTLGDVIHNVSSWTSMLKKTLPGAIHP